MDCVAFDFLDVDNFGVGLFVDYAFIPFDNCVASGFLIELSFEIGVDEDGRGCGGMEEE